MNDTDDDKTDVVGVQVAERGDIRLDTDLLRATIDGQSTGLRTLKWADRVCVVAGTDDGDNTVTVAQTFTPDQARAVAATLDEAADEAERLGAEAAEYEPAEEQSLFGRLLG